MTALRFVHGPVRAMKQRRAPRKGDEEWSMHRSKIEVLYAKQNKSLKEVMAIMQREHGFSASRRQYEYHLALWKVSKYTPRSGVLTVPQNSAIDDLETVSSMLGSGLDTSEVSASFDATEMIGAGTPVVDYSGSHQVEPEWLSTLLPPMLWDSTSTFVQQELAALNGKDQNHATASDEDDHHQSTPAPDQDQSRPASLTQFSNCNFIELDQYSVNQTQPDASHALGHQQTTSEHHWQTPNSLSRLWELEMPAAQRTEEQRYRVQKLIWCLWLCGNRSCFTNLARGAEYRIVRVEDDTNRFESHVEKWIDTSSGFPEGMQPALSTRRPSATYLNLTCPTRFASSASLRLHENGISNWKTHASIGYQLAMLKATGKKQEANALLSRLAADLGTAPGRWSFFSSFAMLIRMFQRCLIKEISSLRNLDPDVRSFVGRIFDRNSSAKPDNDGTEKDVGNTSGPHGIVNIEEAAENKAVGVLSLLCYQRWTQNAGYSAEREAFVETNTGFPIAKAFQWTIRLLLYCSKRDRRTSSNTSSNSVNSDGMHISSLAPLSLCSQVLAGLSAMQIHPASLPKGFTNIEEWQAERLSYIWMDWLSRDSSWFLPSLLPSLSTGAAGSNNVAENAINIWQRINR